MTRSALRLAALLAALALFLPLGVEAAACTDCLGKAPGGCCPPSCCTCCAQLSTVSPVRVSAAPVPADLGRTAEPAANRPQSSDPRDVFHVPKDLRA